eukprot:62355_1
MANQDRSWYFVIIFVLLYSKGTIFAEYCNECAMDQSLKDILLQDYVPTYIEINAVKIPFKLFEACQEFRTLYREYVEQILVNKCKDFMICGNTREVKLPVRKEATHSLIKQFKQWNIFGEEWNGDDIRNGIEKLLYQLYKMDIQSWNVTLLDRLIFHSKMVSDYSQYLHNTLTYRALNNHQYEIQLDPAKSWNAQSIEQLIPNIDEDQNKGKTYQIYELKISFTRRYLPLEVSEERDDVNGHM